MDFGTVDYSRLTNLRENIGQAIDRQAQIDAKIQRQQIMAQRQNQTRQIIDDTQTGLNSIGTAPEGRMNREAIREQARMRLGAIGIDPKDIIKSEPEPKQDMSITPFDEYRRKYGEGALDKYNADQKALYETRATTTAGNRTVPIINGEGQAMYVNPKDVANIPGAQLPAQVTTEATNARQSNTINATNKQQRLTDITHYEDANRKLQSDIEEYKVANDKGQYDGVIKAKEAEKSANEKRIAEQNKNLGLPVGTVQPPPAQTTIMTKDEFIKDFENDPSGVHRKPTDAEIEKAKNKYWK